MSQPNFFRNPNSDRILIVCFPSESGGKFVGNCLAWMSVLRRLRQTPEKIIHVHGYAQYLRTQQLQNSQESYNV